MTYGVSLARQTYAFFVSVGFGFALGIVYDIFFVIRNTLSKRRWITLVCDIVFTVSASVLSFLLLLVITDGLVRGYAVIGELLGFFVYYFSLGVFIVKICGKITDILRVVFRFFKRIIVSVFKAVLFPFRKIFAFFSGFFKKMYEKSRKNVKKIVKKSKYYLQVDNTLLYNQRVYKGNAAHCGTRYRKGRKNYRGKKANKNE